LGQIRVSSISRRNIERKVEGRQKKIGRRKKRKVGTLRGR
jgi:hypothetical protein